MAFTAALNDVWQVKIHGRQEEQEVLNVLHFRCAFSDNNVETHLLLVLLNCIVTTLLPGLGSAYHLEKITGMKVSPDLGPEIQVLPDPEGAIQGAVATDVLPTFASCVVGIHTVGAGRTGRGRMFLPGIPEASTTGSFISPESPYWAAVAAFAVCLLTNFKHEGEFEPPNKWWLGVMSRKLGGAKPPFLLAGFHDVASLEPKALIATTRSRKVGHGS